MAEEFVKSTLEQIRHLVQQQKKSKSMNQAVDQINEQLKNLGELQRMMKGLDGTNQMHVANTRDLYYRIEDAVESMFVQLTEAMDTNKKTSVERFVGRHSSARPLLDSVKKILDSVAMGNIMSSRVESHISIIMECLEFTKDTLDSSVQWPRRRYSVGGVENFVGRQGDFDTLRSRIINYHHYSNQVICICGEKGLGKSALAWKIYTHSSVRKRFKGLAWVTITNECRARIVELDILRQLELPKEPEITFDSYIIVVDHVDDIQQWEYIFEGIKKYAGPHTIILLTTCNPDIALRREVRFRHELEPLKEEDGWKLLKKYAFPKEDAPEVGLFPELGKKMACKRNRLPSEISSLGRELNCKTSLLEWHKMNDDLEKCQLSSSDHCRAEQLNSIDAIYQQLSQDVRQCYLYLGGISRSNESIDAQDLMLLWTGEGMFSSVDGGREVSMMRIARNCLRELANKDMLKVKLEEFSTNSRLNLCYVEEAVREFCLNQGIKEDFRLKVVDFYDGNMLDIDASGTLNCETRRLVIHFNSHMKWGKEDWRKIENALDSMSMIRSLVFLNSGSTCVDLPFTYDFAKLKLLRAVHLVRCKFQGRVLPKGIDKLMNLRYLGLLSDDLKEVPVSIRNLRNLSVLNLGSQAAAAQTYNIANTLSVLTQMKHLCLPHSSHTHKLKLEPKTKLNLSKLTELETLIGFNIDIHDLNGLEELTKLRHLIAHAYSTDSVRSIIDFIRRCGTQFETNLWIEKPCDFTLPKAYTALEEALMCHNLHELTLSMVRIDKFPDCEGYFSTKLSELKLIGCKMGEDPMKALGNLPNLRKLCLGYSAYIGTQMTVCGGGFRNLEHLELQGLAELETWEVQQGAMQKLSVVVTRRCPKLKGIPNELTTVSTLKTMDIELPPHALPRDQLQKYLRIFHFVPSCQIKPSMIPARNIRIF